MSAGERVERVGPMGKHPKERACPSCGKVDAPILVVSGTDANGDGVTFRCRTCKHEWTKGPKVKGRA